MVLASTSVSFLFSSASLASGNINIIIHTIELL